MSVEEDNLEWYNKKCTTCKGELDWFSGYYGRYSKCSNFCVKCEQTCYGFCICSKRRWECKECKFCETKIPVEDILCDTCCKECRGACKNECKTCEVNCDTECDCELKCGYCENTVRHYDFIHDKAYQCDGPMCEDCGSNWCWDDQAPCSKPCKECGGACDNGCGCTCEECGEETEKGGCKCYDEEYMAEKKRKDNRDMRKRFTNGQQIRHVIKNSVRIGTYNLETNTIVLNTLSFDTLSGFAKAHYKSAGSNRQTVNGWKECEYKVGDEWKFIN